jgi:hypothetical protein
MNVNPSTVVVIKLVEEFIVFHYKDTEKPADDGWHLYANLSSNIKVHCKNAIMHNDSGPSVIWADGSYSWYIDGVECNNINAFKEMAKLSNEDMTVILLKYGKINF